MVDDKLHWYRFSAVPVTLLPVPFHHVKYITNLITNKLWGRRFHCTFRFTDDLCALNDGCKFGKAFLEIYPTDLELKVENNCSHATFLDVDISVDKGKFLCKIFDKLGFRWLSSNIPSIIFLWFHNVRIFNNR